MSGRQKQHLGRSAGDDTTLEGRDIRAGAPPGVGGERVSGDFAEGAEASAEARHIGQLLDAAEGDADPVADTQQEPGDDDGGSTPSR